MLSYSMVPLFLFPPACLAYGQQWNVPVAVWNMLHLISCRQGCTTIESTAEHYYC